MDPTARGDIVALDLVATHPWLTLYMAAGLVTGGMVLRELRSSRVNEPWRRALPLALIAIHLWPACWLVAMFCALDRRWL